MTRRTLTVATVDARPWEGSSGEVTEAVLAPVRALADEYAGELLQATSTLLTVAFESPTAAVECVVVAIQRAQAQDARDASQAAIRAGLSVGEVDTDEQSGRAIAEAHALCARARPGQILAARVVRLLATSAQAQFIELLEPTPVPGTTAVDTDEVQWRDARPDAIRVLLVDDAALIREAIARLLQDEGFEVVGQCGDASRGLALAMAVRPDIVITDVRMPPSFTLEGLRMALELRSSLPDVGVLVLSNYVETRYAVDLLSEGSRGVGYLLKERVDAVDEFTTAIRRVAAGGTAIDSEIVRTLMDRSRRQGDLEPLSAREAEVLSLMAEGLSNAGIARRLHLSVRTVESHVGSVFGKLGLLPDMSEERRVLAVIEHLRGRTA